MLAYNLLHQLQGLLESVTEERDIWLANHKALNKGYNELDTRWRAEKYRADKLQAAIDGMVEVGMIVKTADGFFREFQPCGLLPPRGTKLYRKPEVKP